MEFIQLKDHLSIYQDQALVRVISRSITNPTEGKLKSIAESVYSKQQGKFYLAMENNEIRGIIGLRIPTGREAELIHFAVAENFEKQGLGKRMLKEILKVEKIEKLTVRGCGLNRNFYKQCGLRVSVKYDEILMNDIYVCTPS